MNPSDPGGECYKQGPSMGPCRHLGPTHGTLTNTDYLGLPRTPVDNMFCLRRYGYVRQDTPLPYTMFDPDITARIQDRPKIALRTCAIGNGTTVDTPLSTIPFRPVETTVVWLSWYTHRLPRPNGIMRFGILAWLVIAKLVDSIWSQF